MACVRPKRVGGCAGAGVTGSVQPAAAAPTAGR